jgi:hypothetical protein
MAEVSKRGFAPVYPGCCPPGQASWLAGRSSGGYWHPPFPGATGEERHFRWISSGAYGQSPVQVARRMESTRSRSASEAAKLEGVVVELAGTTSWRFEESARDDLLHVALFVRDAVGLPVVPGSAVPPRLAGTVPDHRDLLREDERQDAGRQWASWWTAVLGLEDHSQEPPDADAVRSLGARRERAGSPPDFAALTDRPSLHRAVVEAWLEAHRWVGQRRLDFHGKQREGCFPDRLIRQIAEDVAFDHSVDVGAVRARAVLLDVERSWWHLLAPGTVVCSMAATAEPETAQLVLRQAFESGLRR